MRRRRKIHLSSLLLLLQSSFEQSSLVHATMGSQWCGGGGNYEGLPCCRARFWAGRPPLLLLLHDIGGGGCSGRRERLVLLSAAESGRRSKLLLGVPWLLLLLLSRLQQSAAQLPGCCTPASCAARPAQRKASIKRQSEEKWATF